MGTIDATPKDAAGEAAPHIVVRDLLMAYGDLFYNTGFYDDALAAYHRVLTSSWR